MQRQKVKILYYPKANHDEEKMDLDRIKENNCILKVKHIKSAGEDEKVLKVFYVPKNKKKNDLCTKD